MAVIDFYACYTSGEPPMTAKQLAAWRDLGLTGCRYSLDGSVVFANKADPTGLMNGPSIEPDFSATDQHLNALHDAGFAVTLNLLWLPPWMTEGKPSYARYENGCFVVDPPGSGNARYRDPQKGESRDDCNINPPHVNDRSVRWLAIQLAIRYPWVTTWAAWNEWNSYWPPSMCPLPRDEDLRRYFDELLIPFTQGIRTVLPAASLTLCQADGPDIFRRVLQEEKDRGLHLGDRLSSHPYGNPALWPQDSYAQLAEFWRVVVETGLRRGRPMDADEIAVPAGAPAGSTIAEWLQNVLWLRTRETIDRDTFQILFDFARITFCSAAPFFNADLSLTSEGANVKGIIGKVGA